MLGAAHAPTDAFDIALTSRCSRSIMGGFSKSRMCGACMSGPSRHPMGHRCFAANGYDVEYLRVPVTDEKAPKTSDFAILAARAWDPPEGAALMYNCQMGRGRTTTGMIIASLIILRRRLSDSKGTANHMRVTRLRALQYSCKQVCNTGVDNMR